MGDSWSGRLCDRPKNKLCKLPVATWWGVPHPYQSFSGLNHPTPPFCCRVLHDLIYRPTNRARSDYRAPQQSRNKPLPRQLWTPVNSPTLAAIMYVSLTYRRRFSEAANSPSNQKPDQVTDCVQLRIACEPFVTEAAIYSSLLRLFPKQVSLKRNYTCSRVNRGNQRGISTSPTTRWISSQESIFPCRTCIGCRLDIFLQSSLSVRIYFRSV